MEANRKRSRGLLKSKLMALSFDRAPATKPKPSSTAQYGSTRVKPTQGQSNIVVHQDYAMAQPKPKVSIMVADNGRDIVSQLEEIYGDADEHVDTKASIYISAVQERFKLERVNSERNFRDSQV